MRLERASSKAIRYACINFHYAKVMPVVSIAFSVFNSNNDWCGVITFGYGASANMGKPYKLHHGQFLELTRMALNGKQESTSKAMSVAIRLIKKNCKTVKLLISYADKGQNHKGIIYQATNWYFEGIKNVNKLGAYIIKGKKTHPRLINSKGIKCNLESIKKHLDPNAKIFKTKGKIKYIYPLHKDMIDFCKNISKEYIK